MYALPESGCFYAALIFLFKLRKMHHIGRNYFGKKNKYAVSVWQLTKLIKSNLGRKEIIQENKWNSLIKRTLNDIKFNY